MFGILHLDFGSTYLGKRPYRKINLISLVLIPVNARRAYEVFFWRLSAASIEEGQMLS